MKLPQQWLKPPGSLLIALFLLTLGSVSALAWFGWRFVEQERLVEGQRAQQRLEETADVLATQLRASLAESANRLTDDGSITTYPPGPLLYLPSDNAAIEAPAAFAGPELFEFVQHQPAEAIRAYQRLVDTSSDPAIRAGALLRLARVTKSRAVWQRLAYGPTSNLIDSGISIQIAALLELGDTSTLLDGLRKGRWRLSRGQFEFYWSKATKTEEPPAGAVALSEAAARAMQLVSAPDMPARGHDIVWAASKPWLVLWRGRSLLLADPEQWLKQTATPANLRYALIDSQGRTIAGERTAPATGRAAIRPAAETQLPWTIYAASVAPTSAATLLVQQRYLLSGIGVMVLFLVLGTYFVARAIRKEAEVSRMQADFVSSVSHEFRSPLTSMRQLSEILAQGRVPNEQRRQLYYDTLVRETTRLQRVVEAFGKRSYQFEPLDVASIIRNAVADFNSARAIELHEPQVACTVDGDGEAIAVALRNLLDNAIKYSPESEPVILEWRRQNGHVAIAVHDHGPGVAESEQRAIFQRFVRGTAAAARNVKGSGLGLAMVRDIVAAHKGQVTLTSKPGEGSTFTLLLPAAEHAL
ncbi:MAG TPA: HAMP domain-containing sensor histidine kinase [Bryobacteraceae bacterium]|nr:HAMP domain-containing sensor histidine kinase [Bryobacteraceae bacterium]